MKDTCGHTSRGTFLENLDYNVVSNNYNSLSFHQRKLLSINTKPTNCRKNMSMKIIKCRDRYRKRKGYSKILESTIIDENRDNRPYAKIRIGSTEIFGLLDSGASISVLGKNSIHSTN